MGVVKLVLSLTIPLLCFLVNAAFSLVLAICRFWTIKEYRKIRILNDEEERLKRGYNNYLKNGIKITNFANALTSIVLTQVVLLDTYEKGYDSTLNGYIGMGVSLIIIGLGLSMIVTAKKDMD